MKTKRTKQVLAWLMTLVISLATLAPATIVVGADTNGSDVIYSNDFSSGTVQTNVGNYVFATENCSSAVADGALTVTKTVSGAYVSIRPDNEGHTEYKNDGAKAMKGDLTLSFKLMINNNTDEIGTLKCGDNAVSRTALEFLGIKEASIRTSGVNKAIALNEWNTIEVVFNYDVVSAKFASYTVVLNGEMLKTVAITDGPAYINSFELFRWGTTGASFKLDDVHLSFGAGSTTEIYKVDFEGVTKVPTNAERLNNLRVMNGFVNNPKTKVQNGYLSMYSKEQSFVDVNPDKSFGFAGTMTISMKVRPIGTENNGNAFLNVRYKETGSTKTQNVSLVNFAKQNEIKVNGVVKALSPYRFSTIDTVLNFDYAKATYTSATVYVNGELVGTVDVSSKNMASIDWCRILLTYGSDNGADLAFFKVLKGSKLGYQGETSVTEFIGYQATAANADAKTFNLRLLAITTDEDLSKYENVGFKVTATYGSTTMTLPEELGVCTAVYSSVSASAGIDATYTAKDLGGSAIFALNCLNVPTDGGAITFTVTTYYTVAGEDSVEEKTFTFTVDPANDIPKGGVN